MIEAPRSRVLLVAVLASAALVSVSARADDRVAIVADASPHAARADVLEEAHARVRGELSAAGLVVVASVRRWREDPRAALVRASIEQDAVGAIAILTDSEAGPEIWVYDRSIDRTVVQGLASGRERASQAPAILAVRAVEFLKANLAALSVRLPSPDRSLPQPAPAALQERSSPLPAAADRSAPPFRGPSLSLGGALVAGGGAVPSAWGPAVALAWGHRVWSVRVGYTPTTTGSVIRASDGEATIRQQLVSAEALVRVTEAGPLTAFVTAGGGAYGVAVKGRAMSADTFSLAGQGWAGAGLLGMGASARLGRSFGLLLDSRVALLTRALVVRIAPEEPARVATPSVVTTLSLWVAK